MKRLLLCISAIFFSLNLMAQLEVIEGSFKKVEGFVNINIDKMYDDNDKPYAVLKIKTENINDKQRHELNFGGDAQTFFETEYKDGEVWLYISYYATFIKISHPDLSSTEFWFPFDMEPKRGYELTLTNKPSLDEEVLRRIEKLENASTEATANSDDYGYVVVKTGTLEGATVYIDDKKMDMKTPFVSDPIKKGPHKIKVVKDGYETYSDVVVVEGKGMKTVDANLKKGKTTNIHRDNGLVLTPEILMSLSQSADLWFDKNFISVTAQINLEYMLKPCFGFGVGGGYVINDPKALPLYVQMSYYFNTRKTSPYINIKIGYNVGTSEKLVGDKYYGQYIKTDGVFEALTLGINHYHSKFGIKISYNGCKLRWTGYSDDIYTSNYLSISITYSYLIPFGKKK